MGGNKLNHNKSWNTQSMRHMEMVWKAEQRAAEENKKAAELKRQLEEERENMELRKQGKGGDTQRLEWMYQPAGIGGGGDNQKTVDDMLTGKETLATAEERKNKDNKTSLKPSLMGKEPAEEEDGVRRELDNQAKIREDPMLSIKQAEMEQIKAAVERRRMLERIKKGKKKDKKKDKKKHKKKKHKRHKTHEHKNKDQNEEKQDHDVSNAEQVNADGQEDRSAVKTGITKNSDHEKDKDEIKERKHRHNRRRDDYYDNYNEEYENSRGDYNNDIYKDKYRRPREDVDNNHYHRHRYGRRSRHSYHCDSTDINGSGRGDDAHHRRHYHHHRHRHNNNNNNIRRHHSSSSRSPARHNDDEEEEKRRKRKLAEMEENAQWMEEQRRKRIRRLEEKEQKEEEEASTQRRRRTGKGNGHDEAPFLRDVTSSAYMGTTEDLAGRIHRNRHFVSGN